jgi:hypothetical protein
MLSIKFKPWEKQTIPVLILKNFLTDVNWIYKTNMACVNQIDFLRLFTLFKKVWFLRKTKISTFDLKNYLINVDFFCKINMVNQTCTLYTKVRFVRKTNNSNSDLKKRFLGTGWFYS